MGVLIKQLFHLHLYVGYEMIVANSYPPHSRGIINCYYYYDYYYYYYCLPLFLILFYLWNNLIFPLGGKTQWFIYVWAVSWKCYIYSWSMAETITLPAKEWKKESKKQYSPQIKYSLFTKNNKSHIKCQPYDWKVGRLIIDLLCCVFY